jgi:hypothetical protein
MQTQSNPQMSGGNQLTLLSKIIIGVVLVVIFSVGFYFLAKYIVTGTARGYEVDINKAYQVQESFHSNNGKIMEASGLTVKNYGDTIINAIKAKAEQYAGKPEMTAQFIQEKPNEIPSHIWEKFMDMYEKNTVEIRDKELARKSIEQSYENWLVKESGGRFASNFNFPTPKIQKIMDTVISTSTSKKAFETGVDTEVKVGF